MNANKVFRANARKQLGGGIFENTWLMALVACLLYSLVMSVASFISLIIGGFLIFGLNRIFLQLVRNQTNKVDIADLFCGSEHFADLLVLYLLQTLFTVLWTLLFIIPGIVKGYAYSMAFYIKHDHPDYDWRRCLDESQRYMKGYKWQLFCLDLSFFGWIILGVLCCGVGALWVTPYMHASRANFYENLRAIYEPESDDSQNDGFGETAAQGAAQGAAQDAPEYFDVNE